MNSPSAQTKRRRQHTPLLLLLFIGSGFSALVYEVVWFHLLRFTVGSAAISLAILLVSFMGGMSLGSGLFHRFASVRQHPIRVYAMIELAIGACGILVPVVLPLVTKIYVSLAPHGVWSILVRSLICLLILSPPTILMGATLPAIARWMAGRPQGASRLGLFYGGNIFGAVLGTLAAGFYLLRDYDVYVASAAAVLINLLVAAVGLHLARRSSYRSSDLAVIQTRSTSATSPTLLVAMTLSGFTALGAQVVWTRLLSALLGATVYTFSVILAVFLAGLGIGSVAGSMLCRRIDRPVIALAICQALLMPAIALASYAVVQASPFVSIASNEASWVIQRFDDVIRCSIAILPATVLWGASFPLAIAAVGLNQGDPAKVIGRLYALNTIGAIAAIVLISAVLIPALGTPFSQQALIGVAALSSAILMVGIVAPVYDGQGVENVLRVRPMISIAGVLVLVLTGYACAQFVPPLNAGLISYGRETVRWTEDRDYLYVREGRTASVAVSELREIGYRSFHIGGKVVASTFPEDMRLQRLLGHIPAMIHPNPKSVLIIGFGAGVTAGTFVLHDSIERIVIVEIEPVVVSTANEYFNNEHYNVLDDPRTEVIYDDGRHFLATTSETFDIITADPVNPWVKGAAALYTEEFFELCKSRLNRDGLITQWVPLYETNTAAVKSEIGTFLSVFPQGSIWNSQTDGKGYDVFTLAGTGRMTINANELRATLSNNRRLRESLAIVDIHSEQDILRLFAGEYEHVANWLQGFELNRDRNLRLEYLAGLSPDTRVEGDIYAEMTAAIGYPDNLFSLTEDKEEELRRWFKSTYGSRQSMPVPPTDSMGGAHPQQRR